MSTMGATQFKQECLAILDRLGPEGLVITKHGKPVAKLVPIEVESAALIGSLAGKIQVHGDLFTAGLRHFTLEELGKGITAENRHEETDFGPPVGREIL